VSDVDVTVPATPGGVRLDRFLADCSDVGSRGAAERLLRAGAVRVDGEPAARSRRLVGGEVVRYSPPAPAAAPAAVDIGVQVPYEDDHLLVVEKPAGLVTHPASGVRGTTLVHALLDRGIAGGDDPERPGVVHRLDRDTTGLLVFARDPDTHAALATALRARLIERGYVALVHGRPRSRRGTVEAAIGRDHDDGGRMAIDGRAARPAVTHFELREALRDHSLLDLRLETGRTHQIRVHLAAIGLPVVGDALYGRSAGNELGLERQFLHAARIAFDHPATGLRVEISSPLPPDLEDALTRARAA
jgi:23S rRNA pseudouridine1911/1915/1917 synthase